MMTENISNISDSVDYENAGPTMNFQSVFTHARVQCCVTSQNVTAYDVYDIESKANG